MNGEGNKEQLKKETEEKAKVPVCFYDLLDLSLDPNNRSSSFSCFSSCFPSFGTYISQNENGAELQFGNGGDLILPDHFPLPISPIPLRSGEQVVFTSEPPRPGRRR